MSCKEGGAAEGGRFVCVRGVVDFVRFKRAVGLVGRVLAIAAHVAVLSVHV